MLLNLSNSGWLLRNTSCIFCMASVRLPACPLCYLSTLCGLPVSRRCSKWAAKEPRPAGIPVLLGGAGASTPQRQEALPYLCDWECGAGGWEKHENCNCEEKRCVPESRQDEEERKEGKVRMGLTLKKGRPKTPALPAPCHSLPLLLSHRRGVATRDSHTSPQSSWSENSSTSHFKTR